MGEVKEVKLFGLSFYTTMVLQALKLKGVSYEYVEENVDTKSDTIPGLDSYDKKVPVLVVDGQPMTGLLIILEYIDEMWKEPPLFPQEPYMQARYQFWATFIHQELFPLSYLCMLWEAEAHKREFLEHLNKLEEGLQRDFAGEKGAFIHAERPSLLDVIVGSCATGFRVLGENREITSIHLQKERIPVLLSCVEAYEHLEVARDTMTPYDKLLEGVLSKKKFALPIGP